MTLRLSASDTVHATDSVSLDVSLSGSESASMTRSSTLSRSASPSGDTASIDASLSDSVLLSASTSVSLSETVSASTSLSESESSSRSTSETAPSDSATASSEPTGTDALTPSVDQLSLSDSGSLSETQSQSVSASESPSASTSTSLSASESPSTSGSESFSGSDSDQLVSNFERHHVLKASPFFHQYSVKRFLVASSGAGQQPTLVRSWRVPKFRQDTKLQLLRTSNAFDHVDVGRERCTTFLGASGPVGAAAECRKLQTCNTARDPQSTDHTLRISAGAAHQQGSCADPTVFEGLVGIDGAFGGPAYSIGLLASSAAEVDALINTTTGAAGGLLRVTQGTASTSSPFHATALSLHQDRAASPWHLAKVGDHDGAPFDVSPPLDGSLPMGAQAFNGTASPTSAVTCDISDVTAFDVHRGVGVGDIAECVVSIIGGGSRACASVDDAHRACADSTDCVGFTTAVSAPSADKNIANAVDSDRFSEQLLYLHQRVPGYTPIEEIPSLLPHGGVLVRELLFYAKATENARRCTFVMSRATDLALYFQQSAFGEAYAQISFIRAGSTQRRLIKECGGLKTFAARSAGSSVFGVDGVCSSYVLCGIVPTLNVGDTIEVTASSTLHQSTCNHSLSVLAHALPNGTSLIDNATAVVEVTAGSAQPEQAAELLDVTGYTERSLFIPATSQDLVSLNVFVFNADLATLRVAQTAYDCDASSAPNRDCSRDAVTLRRREGLSSVFTPATTTSSLGRCGGRSFFGAGLAGLSGQCAFNYDCSAGRYELSSGLTDGVVTSGFTGWIVVDVDTAFIRSSPSAFTSASFCTEFSATLFVRTAVNGTTDSNATSSSNSTGAAPATNATWAAPTSVFPLLRDGSSSVAAPLVALGSDVAADLNDEDYVREALLGNSAAASAFAQNVSVQRLFNVGPLGAQLPAYSVNWDALPASNALAASANETLAFACVADVVTASQHRCTVPIPAKANRVRIRVAQTDFSANAMTVRYRDAAGIEDVSRTVQCGASSSFSGFSGLRSECQKFLSCVDGFVYPLTSSSTTAGGDAASNFTELELTVTNGLTNGGCDFAFMALVEFSRAEFEVPSGCDGYFCDADRKCITRDRVCDGVTSDCGDLADEAQCGSFTTVETNYFSADALVAAGALLRGSANSSELECRRDAVMLEAPGYIFDAGGAHDDADAAESSESTAAAILSLADFTADPDRPATCLLLPTATATAVRAEPRRFYAASHTDGDAFPGTVYIVLSSVTAYRQCTSILHCSGHGTLRNSSLAGDGTSCSCVCDAQYTGALCNVLRQIGTPAQYTAVMLRPTSAVVFAALEDALSAGNRAVTVAADSLLPFNTTHSAVPFTFSSFDSAALTSYRGALFTRTTLATINLRLANLNQPAISFIFSTDGVSAFEPLTTCDTAVDPVNCPVTTDTLTNLTIAGPNASATTTVTSAKTVGRVLFSGVGFDTYDVVVNSPTSAATSRRQAATTTARLFSCNESTAQATKTNLLATCFITSCIIDVRDTVESFTVVPRTGPAASNNSAVLATCTPSLAVEASAPDNVPAPRADADVLLLLLQTLAFLWSGVAVTAYVVIAAALCIYGFYRQRQSLKLARAAIASNAIFSQLPRWVSTTLIGERLLNHPMGTKDTTVVAGAVSTLFVAATVGLLVVLYVTSGARESNYVLLLTFYQSPVCAGNDDTLRTQPLLATAVDAVDECLTLGIVGQSFGSLVGRAKCTVDPATLERVPSVALAATSDRCLAKAPETIASGTCLDATQLEPSIEAYVVARCVELSSSREILAALAALNPSEQQTAVLRTLEAPAHMSPAYNDNSALLWPRSAQSIQSTSSSYTPARATSIASAALFSGEFLQKRLVGHAADSFNSADAVAPTNASSSTETATSDPRTAAFNVEAPQGPPAIMATLETQYLRQLGSLPVTGDLKDYVPRDGDYPVGSLYGGYGSPNEVAGTSAGPAAHRYFHLQGSAFDVGQFFGEDHVRNTKGYTISIWVRASTDTQGFAFVLCDHLEDTTARTSPVVDRLMDIARDGATSSRPWFQSSFHVYAALFLDGASQTIQFTHADPLDSGYGDESVVSAIWLAPSIGVEVFNDQWHHITLAFKNENAHPFVVIGVDGKSSLSSSEFRRCLPRRFTPIKDHVTVRTTTSTRSAAAVARSGGVLYVGYFNGGVRGVTFDPYFTSSDSAVRVGTRQMRVRTATRRVTMEAIFYFLLLASCVAAFSIAYKLRQILQQRGSVDKMVVERGMHKYVEEAPALFTRRYTKVPWEAAGEFLQLSDYELATLVLELARAPLDDPLDDGSSKFVRCMWIEVNRADFRDATRGELLSAAPTPREWHELLEECDIVPPGSYVEGGEDDIDEGLAPTGGTGGGGGAPPGMGPAQLNSVALAVLATIQAAAIYASTWKLPDVYLDKIVPVLDVLSLDFFPLFNFPTLVGPIVQLCLALMILTLIAFVFVRDGKRFLSNALRYQHRRDAVERLDSQVPERVAHYLLTKVDDNFMTLEAFTYEYHVHLLAPEERCALDEFIKRDLSDGVDEDVCVVHRKATGENFTVLKKRDNGVLLFPGDELPDDIGSPENPLAPKATAAKKRARRLTRASVSVSHALNDEQYPSIRKRQVSINAASDVDGSRRDAAASDAAGDAAAAQRRSSHRASVISSITSSFRRRRRAGSVGSAAARNGERDSRGRESAEALSVQQSDALDPIAAAAAASRAHEARLQQSSSVSPGATGNAVRTSGQVSGALSPATNTSVSPQSKRLMSPGGAPPPRRFVLTEAELAASPVTKGPTSPIDTVRGWLEHAASGDMSPSGNSAIGGEGESPPQGSPGSGGGSPRQGAGAFGLPAAATHDHADDEVRGAFELGPLVVQPPTGIQPASSASLSHQQHDQSVGVADPLSQGDNAGGSANDVVPVTEDTVSEASVLGGHTQTVVDVPGLDVAPHVAFATPAGTATNSSVRDTALPPGDAVKSWARRGSVPSQTSSAPCGDRSGSANETSSFPRTASGVLAEPAGDGDGGGGEEAGPLDLARLGSGMGMSRETHGALGGKLSRKPMAQKLTMAVKMVAGVGKLTRRKRSASIKRVEEVAIEDVSSSSSDRLLPDDAFGSKILGLGDDGEFDGTGTNFRAVAGMTNGQLPRPAPKDIMSARSSASSGGTDTRLPALLVHGAHDGEGPGFDPTSANATLRANTAATSRGRKSISFGGGETVADTEATLGAESDGPFMPPAGVFIEQVDEHGNMTQILSRESEDRRRRFGVIPAVVNHKCVQHHDEYLVPIEHSTVFPYSGRRSCCVVENGVRCGAETGVLYCCPHRGEQYDEDGKLLPDDDPRRETGDDCGYSICEDHLQVGATTRMILQIHTIIRRYTRHGKMWILSLLVVNLAVALYTPTMRTCLMILACHPLYQCEFPSCWTKIDQKFAAAVYLASVAVLFYGLGFPVFFYRVMRYRRKVLGEVFAASCYKGRFLRPLDPDDTPESNMLRIRFSRAVRIIGYVLQPRLLFDDVRDALGAIRDRVHAAYVWMFNIDEDAEEAALQRAGQRGGLISNTRKRAMTMRMLKRRSSASHASFASPTGSRANSVRTGRQSAAGSQQQQSGEEDAAIRKSSMLSLGSGIDHASSGGTGEVLSSHEDVRSGESSRRGSVHNAHRRTSAATDISEEVDTAVAGHIDLGDEDALQVFASFAGIRNVTSIQVGHADDEALAAVLGDAAVVDDTQRHQHCSSPSPSSSSPPQQHLRTDASDMQVRDASAMDGTASSNRNATTGGGFNFTLTQRRRDRGAAISFQIDEANGDGDTSMPPSASTVLAVAGVQPLAAPDTVPVQHQSSPAAPSPSSPLGATRTTLAQSHSFTDRVDTAGSGEGPLTPRRQFRSWFAPPGSFRAHDSTLQQLRRQRVRASAATATTTDPDDADGLGAAFTGVGPRQQLNSISFDESEQTNDDTRGSFDPDEHAVHGKVTKVHKTQYVAAAEWQRFLLTDASVLVPLYWQVNFERITVVPLLHCAKFVLLVPPLLLEPNSFEQLLFIALGELVYATALLYAAPFLSLWMSIIVLLGNIHQFVIVGCQALFAARANEVDLNPVLGPIMLATTLTYLILVVFVVGVMFSMPVIVKARQENSLKSTFHRYGLSRPSDAPLFVRPFNAIGSTGIERRVAAPVADLASESARSSRRPTVTDGGPAAAFRDGDNSSNTTDPFAPWARSTMSSDLEASAANGGGGGVRRARSIGASAVGTHGYDREVPEEQVIADLLAATVRQGNVHNRRRASRAAERASVAMSAASSSTNGGLTTPRGVLGAPKASMRVPRSGGAPSSFRFGNNSIAAASSPVARTPKRDEVDVFGSVADSGDEV